MSELKFKSYGELDISEELIDASHVIIEENGDVKRFPANSIGKVKAVNGVEPDESGNVVFSDSWNDLNDKPFGRLVVAEWEPSSPHAVDADFSFIINGGRPTDVYAIKVGDVPSKDIDFETLQFNDMTLTQVGTGSNSAVFSNAEATPDYTAIIVCYESGEHDTDILSTFTAEAGVYAVYCDDTYGYEIENFENGGFIGKTQTIEESYIPDTIARITDIPKVAAIADVTEAPTAEEFNALLAALRNAGLMATE